MPVNQYFDFTTFTSEQNLIDDLIVESIQIYGHTAYYLTREDVSIDHLFGEDPLAAYPDAHEIEIYLKSNMAFAGASETLSKFGLIIEDDATFLVSVTRFGQEFPGMTRPRENDIIYIQFSAPDNRYLFEIKFVENKEQLFQLGKLYTYELQCQLMNYSHERITTTVPEVNQIGDQQAYAIDIPMEADNGGIGTYVVGETVYQGDTFLLAIATGTVHLWNSNTSTLTVQNVTGEFAFNNTMITGMTSAAAWHPRETIDTAPTEHDKLADNDLLTTEQPDVVVPIVNPRYSS